MNPGLRGKLADPAARLVPLDVFEAMLECQATRPANGQMVH